VTDDAAVPDAPQGEPASPLSPASLYALLFKPTKFFADPRALRKAPEVAIVAWTSGIAYAFGRIDKNIMQSELGRSPGGWSEFGPWLTESWLHYWGFALALGAVNALFLWFIGGWWYRKRLEWSGANAPQPDLVRPVYMYQDFVSSAPAVLATAIQTLLYASYAEAWAAEEYWSALLLVFPIWSCFTSYKAATTAWEVSKGKARFWFLVLPLLVYIFVFGLVGVLYAMLGDGEAALAPGAGSS
jgi:hypothetical protein